VETGKRGHSVYGLMAEFDTPEALLKAARQTREAGYRKVEAYSPFPVEGLSDALGFRSKGVQIAVLAAGILGALGGFALQYWISKIAYPLNVGGRPLNSWPAFIPVTFELTILLAGLTAIASMLALNGLPRPYHPVFNFPGFSLASESRFFLAIEAEDDRFDRENSRSFLENLGPLSVREVRW
jgi:hypothetical protein